MKRSEAFHILNGMYDDAAEEQRTALDMAMNDLEFVDLMPDELSLVVHGEWIEDGYFSYPCVCSICGTPVDKEFRTRYCPNCGAKMDGEREGVPETNVGKMANWKLTDVDESGYEYECPHCFFHIGARVKGRNLPEECPHCGADMRERKTDG